MLLDLVEVAESHTGVNLGIAFVKVLKKFGVEDKVRAKDFSEDLEVAHLSDASCRY
jgi:hypothetical protein